MEESDKPASILGTFDTEELLDELGTRFITMVFAGELPNHELMRESNGSLHGVIGLLKLCQLHFDFLVQYQVERAIQEQKEQQSDGEESSA